MDLDGPGPDSTSVGASGWCSLFSYPYNGSGDSDVEDRESRRRLSRLLSERMSTGGPLLARVQKHQTPAKTRSLEVDAEEADGPCTLPTEEQGHAFKQNMAVIRDMLQADVVPPSSQAVPRAEPLSAVPRVELPRVEVPFLPYVAKRLAELSADLRGEVDGQDNVLSGEQGL